MLHATQRMESVAANLAGEVADAIKVIFIIVFYCLNME